MRFAICALLGAACGGAFQAYFGLLDLPFGLVYVLQALNGLNLGVVVAAVALLDRPGMQLPRRARAVLKYHEERSFTLIFIGIATWVVLAFYELFPPSLPVGLVVFQAAWLVQMPFPPR